MKRLFLLLFDLLPMLASAQNSTSDNNVIRYTTSDNKVLNKKDICNANLISNTYADGQGVMVFDKTITWIGSEAFKGCTSLESITIPNSVTYIGSFEFQGCTSLTSVTIPNSVTYIGSFAFQDCTSLPVIDGLQYADTYLVGAVDKTRTSYSIRKGTRFIGSYAFAGCTSLKSVYCKPATPPTAHFGIFHDNEGKPLGCKIHVPRASVEAYKTAEGWKEYADNIVGYDF